LAMGRMPVPARRNAIPPGW